MNNRNEEAVALPVVDNKAGSTPAVPIKTKNGEQKPNDELLS